MSTTLLESQVLSETSEAEALRRSVNIELDSFSPPVGPGSWPQPFSLSTAQPAKNVAATTTGHESARRERAVFSSWKFSFRQAEAPDQKFLDQIEDDQNSILKLLDEKAGWETDGPDIARRLWTCPDEGWAGSLPNPDASYAPSGQEFLNRLVPCGRRRAQGAEGGTTNLVLAFESFRKWLARSNGLDPLNHRGFAHGFEADDDGFLRIMRLWPKSWKACTRRGNLLLSWVNYAFPRAFDDPFMYYPELRDTVQRLEFPQGVDVDSMHGITCRISVDRSTGVIDLNNIATILCFSDQNPSFLSSHAARWEAKSDKRFSTSRMLVRKPLLDSGNPSQPSMIPYGYVSFMHYMRSFTVVDFEVNPSPDVVGLRCSREWKTLAGFSSAPVTLLERRYSAMIELYPMHRPCGQYALLTVIDTHPDGSEVKQLDHQGFNLEKGRSSPWKKYGISPAGLFTGIASFQLQISIFIDLWEEDWNTAIRRIDDMVSLKLKITRDAGRLRSPKPDASDVDLVLCSTVSQVLADLSESVKSAPGYLDVLSDHVWNYCLQHSSFMATYPHKESTKSVLDSNWERVKTKQQRTSDRILAKLERTQSELNKLRDEISPVHLLTEPEKGGQMNEYLSDFTTTRTIILVLATFLCMELFNSASIMSIQNILCTILAVLVGSTYVAAYLGISTSSIPAELWRERAEIMRKWRTGLLKGGESMMRKS